MTTAFILAYIGVALMVGISGLSSAIGTGVCGMTAVGAMKKNPGGFGSYMILSAIPTTQGLYGFAGYFLLMDFIVPDMTVLAGAAIFGAGLIVALVSVASAYAQAKICANGIAAVGNGHDVLARTMILGAFPELYAILGLAAVFFVRNALSAM